MLGLLYFFFFMTLYYEDVDIILVFQIEKLLHVLTAVYDGFMLHFIHLLVEMLFQYESFRLEI